MLGDMGKGKGTFEELRADLLSRWKAAFARLAMVKAKVPGVVETVYTPYPAFALANYSPKKFKPGARLAKKPSRDGNDYAYQLDAQGRPLHMRTSHRFNRVDWQGVYRYGETEVEVVEFCMQTGTPSLYNRLILDGQHVLAEQRFVCNSGGSDSGLKKLSTAKKIERVLSDPYNYFIYLTRYRVEDGIIRGGEEYHEVSGKIDRPTLEYTYATDGALQRIVQVWPGGFRRTQFAAKGSGPKVSLKDLSEKLSEKLAKDILARLKKTKFGARLVALELSYRYPQHHIPQLIPLTERDEVESLTLAAEIDSKRWIELSEEDFVPEITQFNERVQDSETAVAKMLRAAALLVTKAAPKAIKVTPGFVAFPIDWELEGDDLGKILKQCGASPAKLREWKNQGWL